MRSHYENAIKEMNEYLNSLKDLRKTNPELARKIAREGLQKSGIIDENGNLNAPYNGQNVNEDDFTRGSLKRNNYDVER